MRLRSFAADKIERAFEIGVTIAEPFVDPRVVERQRQAQIDTQDLALRAGRIIDTDPERALLARFVMVELEAGNMTPAEVDFYLTPPAERPQP